MNARVVWFGGLSAILALAAAYLHLSPGEGLPGAEGGSPFASSNAPSPASVTASVEAMLPRLPGISPMVENVDVASATATTIREPLPAAPVAAQLPVQSVAPGAGVPGESVPSVRAPVASSLTLSDASGEASRKSQREAESSHQVTASNAQGQRRASATEKPRRSSDNGITESAPTRPARVLAEEGDSYVSPARGLSTDERPGGKVWVIPKLQDMRPDVELRREFDADDHLQAPARLAGAAVGHGLVAAAERMSAHLPG